MSSEHPISLRIRGRGRRTLQPDQALLVSRRGLEPPQTVSCACVMPGDYVAITYGASWPSAPAALPVLEDRPLYGCEKKIHVPEHLTSDLAFLLGAYLSEGHTTRSNWSVILTNSVLPVLEKAQRAWWTVFGLQARITRQPGKCTGLVVSSKRLVEYMEVLGCGSRAADKQVPHVMYAAPRSDVLAFMQGVALDAYTTNSPSGKWAICLESGKAIDQLQDLLTRLGVVNAQIPKLNKKNGKTYYELYAAGPWGQMMSRLVPFLEPPKAESAEIYLQRVYRTAGTDVIPGITGQQIYDSIPTGRCGPTGRGTGRQMFRHLRDPRTRRITRASVEAAMMAGANLPPWLGEVIQENRRFAEVTDVRVCHRLPTSFRPLRRAQWVGVMPL